MAQLLSWDGVGEKFFENGVDHGVLYLPNGSGVYDTGFAWNGLTAVTQAPSGAESNKQYADNIVYANLQSAEEFSATIEAFTYPDEFGPCDGTAEPQPGVVVGQQGRSTFGLSYRTKVGNDVNPELGYKLHLVYGLLASPSEKNHQTVNDNPEATAFSWEVESTPIPVTGYKPTSIISINSVTADPTDLAALEVLLYGDDVGPTQPALPAPDVVLSTFTP